MRLLTLKPFNDVNDGIRYLLFYHTELSIQLQSLLNGDVSSSSVLNDYDGDEQKLKIFQFDGM